MPCSGAQAKYRSPFTLPSFLPLASSSSMPTHRPAAKAVSPTKRTVPLSPSLSVRTRAPGATAACVVLVCVVGGWMPGRGEGWEGKGDGTRCVCLPHCPRTSAADPGADGGCPTFCSRLLLRVAAMRLCSAIEVECE